MAKNILYKKCRHKNTMMKLVNTFSNPFYLSFLFFATKFSICFLGYPMILQNIISMKLYTIKYLSGVSSTAIIVYAPFPRGRHHNLRGHVSSNPYLWKEAYVSAFVNVNAELLFRTGFGCTCMRNLVCGFPENITAISPGNVY